MEKENGKLKKRRRENKGIHWQEDGNADGQGGKRQGGSRKGEAERGEMDGERTLGRMVVNLISIFYLLNLIEPSTNACFLWIR